VSEVYAPAPVPAYRLIPSQFPPIGLFDTVATAADLGAVMELAGWTNDRLVAHRIARLPQSEWVYGNSDLKNMANSSIVMAAFLHVAPGGMRFNNADLGAWYAAASLVTAAAEVGHHLRREAVDRGLKSVERVYRSYTCKLLGDYLDIRHGKANPEVYASGNYKASQQLGETVRARGGAGILYDSLRHQGGVNIVAHRPRNIEDIVQTDHFQIVVQAATQRIEVKKLTTAHKSRQ
jgi:RES domain